ncbi:hypothetical protein CR51_05950 [Caballeronia megalochromosomata]|nr:hypothetical protein CR51_05950 [Caballeronia megalochromosomata]
MSCKRQRFVLVVCFPDKDAAFTRNLYTPDPTCGRSNDDFGVISALIRQHVNPAFSIPPVVLFSHAKRVKLMTFPEQGDVGDIQSKFDRLLSIAPAHLEGARELASTILLGSAEI